MKCLTSVVVLVVAVWGARMAEGAKFVSLGDLPGGSFYSQATGVSADGSVVVGVGVSASGDEAFRWTSGGGMVGLGDLPGGSFVSFASGVSADGSVVVGRGVSASGDEAFRWTSGGGMVGLGDLPGGSFVSSSGGVSADGSVVVGQSFSASGFESFRWTSGSGMVGLGDLAGSVFSSNATGVSADGSVVVGFGNSASGPEAFRWTAGGGMVGLGDLPGGGFLSYAVGVSADGSVVVGVGGTATSAEPFVWDAANGMRSVRDVIAPTVGAALNGWTLYDAWAVSADGRTVVGNGLNPSGDTEAWLAYLPDQILWSPNTSGSWDADMSWSGPFQPGAADDVVIDPTAAVTVTGPSTHATIRSLSIGGSTTARVTLALTSPNSGDLTVTNGATLAHNAELVLLNGRSITAGTNVTNSGVIRGTGTVSASLVNNADGEVRVAAGESLVVSGASHTNAGKVEAIDGSIEFIGGVTNAASSGLVTGRDATLRFQNGLTNGGSVALTGGASDVSGDITNSVGATISVTGGASAVFYDDIVQNGTFRVRKVGTTTSTAVVLGSFTGSGGSEGGGDIFFEGDLRPGNSPASVTFSNNIALGGGARLDIELGGLSAGSQYDRVNVTGSLALGGSLNVSLIASFTPAAGNSFDILDFNPTTLSGTFDTISLPALDGGLVWNTSQLYTAGVLSVGVAGDYNNNGAVDAADYVLWRKGGPLANEVDVPGTVNGADYAAWRARVGNSGSGVGSGSAGASPSQVPEPASAGLLVLAALVATVLRVSERRGHVVASAAADANGATK